MSLGQNKPVTVIAGFDGHGSISGIVYAKANGIPSTNVIIRYPDTSPEGTPRLLYSLNLYNAEVVLLDIAINIKNPAEWLNTMRIISQNNKVIMYDHHSSNIKYINQLKELGIVLFQFSDTVDMNKVISGDDTDLFKFSLIGTVTDRDPAIKKVLSEKEISEYLAIANRYDTLIRSNLQATVNTLLSTPKEGLLDTLKSMVSGIDYPPERLVSQVQLIRKYYNVHVIRLPSPQVLGQWTWKVLDQYAMINNLEYLVAIGSVLDRQINAQVPVIFVIKYWLSDSPSPLNVVKQLVQNRKIIGHADGFSVSATSESDAEQLAIQIAETLTSPSNVVQFLPASTITNAIANDYRAILQKLAEILEEQKKMYSEYLQLKREQVNLLKNAGSEDRRRYD